MTLVPEPEQPEETQLIQQQWQQWSVLVEEKGETIDPSFKQYLFAIDRRSEEASKVTVDDVEVLKLNESLEEWRGKDSPANEMGEKWIQIRVRPDNPYRLVVGVHPAAIGGMTQDDYYVRSMNIYLSNKGKAFEEPVWGSALAPDFHSVQHPSILYLKQYPRSEDIQTTLTQEPMGEGIAPLQPLNGHSLERIADLLRKAQSNQVILRRISKSLNELTSP